LQVHAREGDSLSEDREREDFQPVQPSRMRVWGFNRLVGTTTFMK